MACAWECTVAGVVLGLIHYSNITFSVCQWLAVHDVNEESVRMPTILSVEGLVMKAAWTGQVFAC